MRSQGKERPAHYWFSFVSDWLGKWREFFGQSHDEVNKKKQSNAGLLLTLDGKLLYCDAVFF